VRIELPRLPDRSREGTKKDKRQENVMTIRKQGSATGRVLGVESPEPDLEPLADGAGEDDGLLVDRPLQGGAPAADEADG
jgi:hypothetical protein